jgi:hypothetical protein
MAQAAKIDDVDIPLIEEHVETGLTALLAGYKPSYIPGGAVENELDGHYRIDPSRPLDLFSHTYAQAFEAEDLTNPERNMYAMVCDPELPYRSQAISDTAGLINPHMVSAVAAGTVRCSHLNAARYVIFYERPQGAPLADLISTGGRIHESKIIPLVLEPACRALLALQERKVHHGNIHAGAFFIGESSMLGECFSAPAGTLAHYLYEPVERIMADPLGRGEANEKTDMYALGILVYEALFGLERIKTLPKNEYIERVLRQGTYTIFTTGRDLPEGLQDFFRGVLNDSVTERWGLSHLAKFVSGKSFNMIAPSPPKDAARPFLLGGQNIFSRRLLANLLHRNWRETVREIRSMKLDRWCETSLHRPELAERVERALRTSVTATNNERQAGEMMMRIFAILDPTGPIRTQHVSTRPDGIPIMFAALINDKGAERRELISMIYSDICAYWVDQLETNKTPEMSQLVWRLKNSKALLDNHSLGFGIERVLYDLNPSLCCQSPLLKPYHVTTVADLLCTMDAIARTVAPDTNLVDNHIAAFVASKMDMGKRIRLDDLTRIPVLAQNQELIMIRLLAKAQMKHPKLKLVGLCAWSGMRIEKMIDEIHNRIIRKSQKLQLKKLASGGILRDILAVIVNSTIATRDTNGFAHAVALHGINLKRIEYLENPLILKYKARKIGGKAAVAISFTALVVMGYNAIINLSGI